ncbi:MAG: hypothetical protein Q9163_000282 [Psora crenata]
MWNELPPLFSHISLDPNIRAVVLSGAGPKAFTTGLDVQAASQTSILNPNTLKAPAQGPCSNSDITLNHNDEACPPPTDPPPSSSPPLDPARIATQMRRHIIRFQACLTAVAQCEKPLLAALHGYCLGLGVDLSLCADVRICAADTTFAVKEVDIGLAADIGTLTRLPKLVRSGSWVKDVCLSARAFGAEEARREGFVNWTGTEGLKGAEAKEEVLKYATQWAALVASKSPIAVQGTKELLDWGWDRGVEEGLRYTAIWNSAMLQTEDVGEAMSAGMAKRRPRYSKL